MSNKHIVAAIVATAAFIGIWHRALSWHEMMGWKIDFPNNIQVINQAGWGGVASMVQDFDSTELGMTLLSCLNCQNASKSWVRIKRGNWCQMGDNWALTQTFSFDNKSHTCTSFPEGRDLGKCNSTDHKVRYAYIYINECNKALYRWLYMGGFARRVVTHEMGHVVGLGHYSCSEDDSVMKQTVDCFNKSNFIDHLETIDVSDINGLYP